MKKYMISLMVTFEQEYAIERLYCRHGWDFIKINTKADEIIDKPKTTADSFETSPSQDRVSTPKQASFTISSPVSLTNRAYDLIKPPNEEAAKTVELVNAVDRKREVTNAAVDKTRGGDECSDNIDRSNEPSEFFEIYNEVDDTDIDTEDIVKDLQKVVKEEVTSSGEETVQAVDDISEITKKSTTHKRASPIKSPHTRKKRKTNKRNCVKARNVNRISKSHTDSSSMEETTADKDFTEIEIMEDIIHVSVLVGTENSVSAPSDIDGTGYCESLGVFYCTDCNFTFPEKKYYTDHKREGKCVFLCPFCSMEFTFKNFSKYQEHLKQHKMNNMIDSSGEINNAVRGLRSDSDTAKMQTTGVVAKNKHTCPVCKVSLASSYSRKRHMIIHEDNEKVQCSFCPMTFKRNDCLKTHEKNFHHPKSAEDLTICSVCGKICKSKKALTDHLRVHVKKHMCEICCSKFATSFALTRHLKSHDQERYKCPKCNKHFVQLQSHMKRCGKNSVVPDNEFQCHICLELFKERRYLNQHIYTVHHHAMYTCSICSAIFHHRSGRLRHMRIYHP